MANALDKMEKSNNAMTIQIKDIPEIWEQEARALRSVASRTFHYNKLGFLKLNARADQLEKCAKELRDILSTLKP